MVGKTYVNEMGTQHVVSDLKDGFVYFSNGARIKQDLFGLRFSEVPNVNLETSVMNSPIYAAIMNGVVGEIEEDDQVYVSGISEETKRLMESQITRIEAPRTEEGDVVPLEERVDPVQNKPAQNNKPIQAQEQSIQTELPEQAMLKRFKRVHDVTLSFSIAETIPDPESLKVIDNLFEKSMVELLAEEIANKLSSDKTLLISVITESIRDIVYPKTVKRVKKPVNKSTKPVKKPVNKTTKPVKSNE